MSHLGNNSPTVGTTEFWYFHHKNSINGENFKIFWHIVFDKLLTLNNEFNDRLERANNELITAKSQLLFLEDKRNTAEGDKKHWEDEYFKLDKENKALTKQLEKRNKVLLIVTTVLITLLVTFIVALITFNVPKVKDASPTEVQEVTEVQQPKVTPPQPVQNQRPVQKRTTYNQRKY